MDEATTLGPMVKIALPIFCTNKLTIQLMNNSEYGLTASIWTKDKDKALKLADDLKQALFYESL